MRPNKLFPLGFAQHQPTFYLTQPTALLSVEIIGKKYFFSGSICTITRGIDTSRFCDRLHMHVVSLAKILVTFDQEKFLIDQKKLVDRDKHQLDEVFFSYKIEQECLRLAEEKLKIACKHDKKCFEEYEKDKKIITSYQNKP